MTVKPFKKRGASLRAAVWGAGTHSRVVRYIVYRPDGRYAIHRASRGRLGRRLAGGRGTQEDALKHGCAEGWALDMPGVWKRVVLNAAVHGSAKPYPAPACKQIGKAQ
jgi:hypothetical protein